MTKYVFSRNQLLTQLFDQMDFITNSNALYDSGKLNEGKRIATAIRVLLHDTQKSKSLFRLLNLKGNFLFVSTSGMYSVRNLLPQFPLLGVEFDEHGASYVPKGDKLLNEAMLLSFEDWWNQIIFDDNNFKLSRRNIILDVANQDGGAHVDTELKESYGALGYQNSLGWTDQTGRPTIGNPAYAALRQISNELVMSFNLLISDLSKYTIDNTDKYHMVFFNTDKKMRFIQIDSDKLESEKIAESNDYVRERRKVIHIDYGNGNRFLAVLKSTKAIKLHGCEDLKYDNEVG
ncbi:hypothetical protein [Levilactobacillus enshiensis]|uniref:hypothetical protein n=1 Tax=Levilactobacillus enshiensis TaxID=2590213 RepID=UPI00117BB95F|nr:hypothetical protein [Levilactobacillus enshiensis]